MLCASRYLRMYCVEFHTILLSGIRWRLWVHVRASKPNWYLRLMVSLVTQLMRFLTYSYGVVDRSVRV